MKNANFIVKNLSSYFEDIDEIPLFRGKPFSFDDFSLSLKNELGLENFSVFCQIEGWQAKDKIQKNLGKNLSHLCLTFTPLLGNVYLLMDHSDIKTLISTLLTINKKKNFSSPILEEGYYRYLILLALETLKKTKTFTGLSPKIVEDAKLISDYAYSLNISIRINEKYDINAKIAITDDFRRSWNDFYSSSKSISIDQLKALLEIPLSVIGGHSFLTQKEIKGLNKGDFILLDKSSIDPESDGSRVVLTSNDSPLFHAKILKNKIHILDYANYIEENEPMNDKKHIEEEPFENPDENLPEEEPLEEDSEKEELTSFEEKRINLDEVPVKLTVELAKISFTLEKLMQLQPGNYLQLPIDLKNPVNLTVNGKIIAKAELTKLGDVLGVRILEIG